MALLKHPSLEGLFHPAGGGPTEAGGDGGALLAEAWRTRPLQGSHALLPSLRLENGQGHRHMATSEGNRAVLPDYQD